MGIAGQKTGQGQTIQGSGLAGALPLVQVCTRIAAFSLSPLPSPALNALLGCTSQFTIEAALGMGRANQEGCGVFKFYLHIPSFISTCTFPLLATHILSSFPDNLSPVIVTYAHIYIHESGANNRGCMGSGVAGTSGTSGIIFASGSAMAVATGICIGCNAGRAGANIQQTRT